jgi:eukaryotic-like serine/threonine-protein kinase
LVRRLGAGGMAEVWLARRADGAFKRDVALKLPMRTLLRADLEQRFVRERDILASLEHPLIARLYDAGVDSNGLSYLSMEYVHGAPLMDWCATHGLGIQARVELFLEVLEAVQYAHDKQVIHLDLKPSNILVTDAGQVRLLDFGVARLLAAEETDQTPLTSVLGRALTPDYASPELLQGEPLDARSDIYSLGVLLYELLTGSRPYRLRSASSMGLLDQAIAAIEIKKPSMQLARAVSATPVTRPQHWMRQLQGDLDAITLKSLAKNPTQRYVSVTALVADLRRYLDGKPVQAQTSSIPYRVRKFVLRNQIAMAAGTAAAVAIFAAAGYTLHRERRTQVTVTASAPELRNSIPAQAPGLQTVAAVAPPVHSVAVLPFLDMSEKRDHEYFSDGLAEELADLLANVPGLHVIARSSSFSFKGKSDDIPSIARKLNVANILEGSVRKSGNRVRVTTRLIRAADGENIWSQSYDRNLQDVFEVQDQIAAAVVSALQVKLAAGQRTFNAHRTSNLDAYNEYLLGRQFFDHFTVDGFQRASAAYRRATELDPGYAAAYVGLAMSEFFAADGSDDAAGRRRALLAADKAVALAPDQADGYAARGHIHTQGDWDWSGAQADFEKALSIDPANTMALRRYALLLGSLGRLPEAVAMTKQAIELDPLSSVTWTNLAGLLMGERQIAAAGNAIHRALEIQPESSYGLTTLGKLQLLDGDSAGLIETARRLNGEGFRLRTTAMVEHSLGHARDSEQALKLLIARFAHDCAYCVAEVYAWRGEADATFEWLDRAYQQRESDLASIKFDPVMNSVQGDSRYAALLRKMKLPE